MSSIINYVRVKKKQKNKNILEFENVLKNFILVVWVDEIWDEISEWFYVTNQTIWEKKNLGLRLKWELSDRQQFKIMAQRT